MRFLTRFSLAAFAITLAATAAGCSIHWSQDNGLCFKPLLHVRVELNRNESSRAEPCCQECNGADGGMIDGGMIEGGAIPGGFVPTGPLTVETEPLPLHAFPGVQAPLLTDQFLSASPSAVAANPPPVFGPNATANTTTPTPPSSTSAGSIETAKKRPGSLNVSTGLDLNDVRVGANGDQSNVLRVGQRTVFGVYIVNQGDLPIEATQLQGAFTPNLKPVSIIRSAGPTSEGLRPTTTSARIEGQRVVFDKLTQFGPETKYEYKITVDVVASGPGNFEVTEVSGPSVKKNTAVTALGR